MPIEQRRYPKGASQRFRPDGKLHEQVARISLALNTGYLLIWSAW